MASQQPLVTERITHYPNAFSPELILEWHEHGGSRTHCPLKRLIDVRDVQMDGNGRCAKRAWTSYAVLRVFIAQHDGSRADLDFRMPNAAAGLGQSKQFLRAKGAGVDLYCIGGAMDAQIPVDLVNGAHG